MAENTVQLKRSAGFTVLQNALIRDPRLSLKTKGLFAVLASLPEDWKYSISGLSTVAGVGRDAIRTALKELEKAGYLTRRQEHSEGGHFSGCVYEISDTSSIPVEPSAPPLSGFPSTVEPTTVEPSSDNPTLQNKDITKERLTNTPYSPPEGDDGEDDESKEAEVSLPKYEPEMFTAFYERYPVKKGRKAACRAWDKLKPSAKLMKTMGAALRMQIRFWKAEGKLDYAPHPSTWLNGRRWEDDPAEYEVAAVGTTSGSVWADDPEVT